MSSPRFKSNLVDDMSVSDLIISHCGAGSILEALSMKKQLIVVINGSLQDNHQLELSDALSDGRFCHSTEPAALLTTIIEAYSNQINNDNNRCFPICDSFMLPRLLDSMFAAKRD